MIEGSIGSLRIDPDDVAGLINMGTLRATDGGVLQLEGGTFDSRGGGLIHAADGSVVGLGQDGRILGGTITTEGTGRVATVGNGVDPIFAGTITNNGQIELDTINAHADLRIDGEVTLTGNGSLTLIHPAFSRVTSLAGGPADVLINGLDHTIAGRGPIVVDLVNNGAVMGDSAANQLVLSGKVSGTGSLGNVTISGTHQPGASPAVVPLTGAYSLTSAARLKMEIGGLTPGSEHDQLDSDGMVALGGVLDIDPFFADGVPYLPAIDDTFTIITADGGITGTFSNSANVVSNFVGYQVKWNVLYDTNSVAVEVATITGFGIPGDFDLDGDVDGDDLDEWQGAYNATDIGDADADGDSDGRDFLIWQRQFGTPPLVALTANIAVPEPSALVLLVGGVLAGRRRVYAGRVR